METTKKIKINENDNQHAYGVEFVSLRPSLRKFNLSNKQL